MDALGRHILVEFSNCDPEKLNDVSYIETSMLEDAENAGATVINSTFHHFSPFGVSGVIVIQESHLAIHTWPEYQYAALDLFTCGDAVDPWISFDYLKEILSASNYSALEINRGSMKLLDRIEFDARNIREAVKLSNQNIKKTRDVWFTDKDENQALSLRYSGEVLYDKSSTLQRVRVLETFGYGKMLTIDNMIMCTEKDESHYHEMICHPAIFSHGKIEKVLIIGGGDGGTAREVLRHRNIKKVTMVEVDANVIEASKKHLPNISKSFSDRRLNIVVDDGIKYVKIQKENSFDLIIVDGSDPIGPAEGLFTTTFYEDCYMLLKNDGILVAQGESPNFNSKIFTDLNKLLRSIFVENDVHVLLFSIPTYPSGIWSFQLATKGKINIKKINDDYYNSFKHLANLKYYNNEIHLAAFSLPNYIKKMLSQNEKLTSI